MLCSRECRSYHSVGLATPPLSHHDHERSLWHESITSAATGKITSISDPGLSSGSIAHREEEHQVAPEAEVCAVSKIWSRSSETNCV